MLYQRRYNDKNIIDNLPQATELVVKYLEQYVGTFEPLASAKCHQDNGRDLTVQQIRIVLNCMLQDGDVRNMPELPRKFFDAGSGGRPVAHITDFTDGDFVTNEVSIQDKPKSDLVFKSRWRYDLGISTQTYASAIHAINQNPWEMGGVVVRYQNHPDKLYLDLRWVCQHYGRDKSKSRLLSPADAVELIETGKWWCCSICRKKSRDTYKGIPTGWADE